tara:strand:+ start:669 stop:941 length:273 start_codon:yes stop_codon:yes gene_type:complete
MVIILTLLLQEGGFQGRTNKLVDGCYSFWQGALFPMLAAVILDDETCLLNALTQVSGFLVEFMSLRLVQEYFNSLILFIYLLLGKRLFVT